VQIVAYKKGKEEPIALLEETLENLQQDNIKPENVNIIDLSRACQLAEEIKDTADELKHRYWELEKNNNPEEIKKKLQKNYRVK
ncbi:MAG: hypothetical protein ACREBJ_00820, partial [Nitrosotalea sp.]